jgi:hypothetical protein
VGATSTRIPTGLAATAAGRSSPSARSSRRARSDAFQLGLVARPSRAIHNAPARHHTDYPWNARCAYFTGPDHELNRAPETREAGEADEPRHDTRTDRRHAVGETPATNPERTPGAVPAGTAPATNGHVPVRVPTSPTPDPQDVLAPARPVPAPASEYGPGAEPGHHTGQNGHHGPVRTGRVPDGDILAWLREQAGTTGEVPGRRKVIDEWALGSPRADRLRRIVRAEAARNAVASAG